MLHHGKGNRAWEDPLTEIGVYICLQQTPHEYMLQMHMVFQEGSDVWLVLDRGDEGDLWKAVTDASKKGALLDFAQMERWTAQLLSALAHLHGRSIGHRDISLENVLLRHGDVRLMDFGAAVRTWSHDTPDAALRFFLPVGKKVFRAPECYVPPVANVEVDVPWGCRGGQLIFVTTNPPARSAHDDALYLCELRLPHNAEEGQRCLAQPWGYDATEADVFSCGTCLYIMVTGKLPWTMAKTKDDRFAWTLDHSIVLRWPDSRESIRRFARIT